MEKPQLQLVFEQCVESCADSLYRVAFRLTGDQTLASELVQETYLNAWKSLKTLKDPLKIRGWIFAILRNQYTKLIRKEAKSAKPSELLDNVEAKPEPGQERAEAVQVALSELSDTHKLPLLLVSMEGLTVEEAATVLELPKGTVLSRLHRGREKLKQILIRQGLEQTTPQD